LRRFWRWLFRALSANGKGEGAAGKEEISVLGAYHEDMIKALAEKFEAQTGIHVNFLRLATGEATARLNAEKANPGFNVFIGGTVDAHESLKKGGVLAVYKSPVESQIDSVYIDPDGVWKAQYVEVLSIGVNSDRWAKEFASKNIAKPKSLEDLLNPAFKGEIIMPDPSTSGTGYTFLSSVLAKYGEAAGWDLITKINAQVAEYTTSGATPAQKAGIGEYALCVNFFADQLMVKNNSGYPIESTVYQDAGWSMCPVSLIKGSENNAAAQKFVDFCLTKDAMDILVDLGTVLAVRADAKAPKGGIPLAQMPINKAYSPVKAADHKKDYVARFTAIKESK